MAHSVNFAKVKREYMNVTLNDEKNTTIMVAMPTKGIMDKMMKLKEYMEDLNQDDVGIDTLDILYDFCASAMSNNKTGYKISAEALSKMLDLDDLMMFISAYGEFVQDVASRQKN